MDTIDKRLLTLFSFDTFAAPINKEQMSTLLVLNTRMSWIDSQLTIESLLSDGLLETSKSSKVAITPKGQEIVRVYKTKIPSNVRVDIQDYIKNHRAQLLGETLSLSNFEQNGDNYTVHLELIENSQALIKLSLLVPNRDLAERICNNWKEHPHIIYRALLKSISNDI